jgi:hypothetical protein
MNELQDAICDRLVGSAISRDWVNGPLHIAAMVLDPQFQLPPPENGKRLTALFRAMNWPRMFCYVIFGASSGLEDEDDRRSLAIGIFREFTPRQKPMRLSGRQYIEAACRLAPRVHPLVCPGDCSLHEEAGRIAADYLAGNEPDARRVLACQRLLSKCPAHKERRARVSLSSSPGHHAVAAYRFLLDGLSRSEPAIFCGDCAREAARTAAKVKGVPGAIEVCRDLGKWLGV